MTQPGINQGDGGAIPAAVAALLYEVNQDVEHDRAAHLSTVDGPRRLLCAAIGVQRNDEPAEVIAVKLAAALGLSGKPDAPGDDLGFLTPQITMAPNHWGRAVTGPLPAAMADPREGPDEAAGRGDQ